MNGNAIYNGRSPFIPIQEDGRIVEQCDALSIGHLFRICYYRHRSWDLVLCGLPIPVLHIRNWRLTLILQTRSSVQLQ